YKNVGISMPGIVFSSGTATIGNASSYFVPGDEIEMNGSSSSLKAWVLSVNNTSIKVESKSGSNPSGTYAIKIIRSGRRNQQSVDMASITTLQNPLNGINNNVYSNVIHSSGTEFNDQWNVFCDCISSYSGADPSISYVTGGKGNWRPRRLFSYLTGRTQSNYDNNTNTRKDGVYTSYNPLYRKAGAKWHLDTTNWTFSSKITIVNPNGLELENQDALGRYSAATYNYNQTLATAVSANARLREIGSDNAESYSANCADGHFKFSNPAIDSSISHTGRKCLKVSSSTPLTMTKILNVPECPSDPFCNIKITMVDVSSVGSPKYNYIFSGPGAISPLAIGWQITNGNPSISITAGNQITVKPIGSWSAIITVTGASGCSEKFTIGNSTSISSMGSGDTTNPIRILPH
ncbi:MAG TPA: hypothetical protein VF411_12115, partial [Bacteroidia bacterium]